MKKTVICFIGTLLALSLAACSPTKVSGTPEGGKKNPEGLTPEMAQEQQQQQKDSKEEGPDPDAPVLQNIMVYWPKEDRSGLDKVMSNAEEVTGETVLEKLIECEALDVGTVLNSFEIEGGEKAGPGVQAGETGGERIGILDVSDIFALETAVETVMVTAIVNTYIENFELDKLEIRINGEAIQSSLVTDGYLYFNENYEKIE